jgi:hypothetical protein
MPGRHGRDAPTALVACDRRAYRAASKKKNDGVTTMSNRGIFIAYTGMLNTAARREDAGHAAAPHSRRRKASFAARLFRRA